MRKILSVMLVLLLVFSSISVFAAYENDVEVAETTISNTSYPAYLVDASSSTKQASNTSVSVRNKYMVYRIPLPVLEDNQIFDSFKFGFTVSRSSNPSSYIASNKMPGEAYSIDDITAANISSVSAGTQVSCTNINSSYWRVTYELADYANECKGQSIMYLAIKGGDVTISIRAGSEADYRPKYSFTPTAVPALSLDYVSLSDGAEITTDTEISFTYSSPVETAEITLNGEAAQSTINSNVVTLTSQLSQLKNYNLSIVATDKYSSSDAYSMSFSTGIDKTSFSGNTSKTMLISENAPSNLVNGGNNVDPSTDDYAYFKMPLPEIGSDGLIDKYTLRFYTMVESTLTSPIQIFKLPGDDWDESTLTVNSDGFAQIIADYDTYGIKNSVKYIEKGPSGDHLYEADLTEYASECLAKGQESLCIAINSTATFKIFGNVNYTTNTYRKPAVYAEILTNPEIAVYDVSLKVPGNTVRTFSFKLLTKASSAEDYVSLINTANGEEYQAQFVYNPYTRTVSLETPVTLEEEKIYRVVLESGMQDDLGNLLSEDIVVSEFATGVDFDVADPKLVLESDVVSDYEKAVSLDLLSIGSSYKYVTEVTNNTDDTLKLIMAIAVYNESHELIAFTFEPADIPNIGTGIYQSEAVTIAVEASDIKAFIWDQNYDPLTAFDYALAHVE